jgi:uncharacterized protein with von Willebrand factor type A (vWA) domain
MFIKRDKSDEMFYSAFLAESEKLQKVVRDGSARHYAYEDLGQDLFTMMYEPTPKDVDAPVPVGLGIAKQALESIKGLREYADLHRLTKLDNVAAGFACESMGRNLINLLPPVGSKSAEDLENMAEAARELGNMGAATHAEEKSKLVQAMLKKADGMRLDEDAMRQKMREGLQQAIADTQEGMEALNAFGAGSDPGALKQGGLKEKMELARTIRKSDKLKEIAKLAGRFTRIAKKKQMEKSTSNTVNAVQMGDTLARTLPSELGKLANAALAPTFFKSYVEKTLLEYKLAGKVAKGQGPVICCIDGSGSMSGTPEYASKGIALALMEVAKKEKRDFVLIQFGSAYEIRTFTAPKGQAETLAVLAELEFFFNGGTDFEAPLGVCVDMIKQSKYNKADIIFITDGYANVSAEFMATYAATKKAKAFACIGILIGGDAKMVPFCDEVFQVADLLGNEQGNADAHERMFKI